VKHVHNWADADSVAPVTRDANPFVREHGLEERFVVLYSGTAGRAHTFDAVLEAARRLADDPEVLFLFVGGGAQIPALRAAGAPVRFLPYQPRGMLAASLSSGHVALVTEAPEAAGLVLPSKTYGAMASGRPILYVGPPDSDVAAMVRAHGCGIAVRHDDPEGIVEAVRTLKDDPALRERMGRAGRHAAEALYDRRHATRRHAAILGELAGGAPVYAVAAG
jgi:glycosyltransferase involved in cell wall biosynthesis